MCSFCDWEPSSSSSSGYSRNVLWGNCSFSSSSSSFCRVGLGFRTCAAFLTENWRLVQLLRLGTLLLLLLLFRLFPQCTLGQLLLFLLLLLLLVWSGRARFSNFWSFFEGEFATCAAFAIGNPPPPPSPAIPAMYFGAIAPPPPPPRFVGSGSVFELVQLF